MRRLASMQSLQGTPAFSGPKHLALCRLLAQARRQGGVIVVVLPVSPPYAAALLDAAALARFEAVARAAMRAVPEAPGSARPHSDAAFTRLLLRSRPPEHAGAPYRDRRLAVDDSGSPRPSVTFASFEFVAFFVAVLLARNACRLRIRRERRLLLVASYAFYATWSPPAVLFLLAVSLVDYHVGRRLATTESARGRQRWLAVSLATNIGLLGFFKYTNFLLANAGWAARLFGVDTSGWRLDIILPVGISFFTFKSMSYTLDVHRRNIEPCRSLPDYLFFVSFFPQLLAGPIARAAELLPQLARRVRATASEVESGLVQFGLGAIKKLVVADQVAGHVNLIFAAPGQFDALTLLQGAAGYTMQIYCDFSGYRTWPSV